MTQLSRLPSVRFGAAGVTSERTAIFVERINRVLDTPNIGLACGCLDEARRLIQALDEARNATHAQLVACERARSTEKADQVRTKLRYVNTEKRVNELVRDLTSARMEMVVLRKQADEQAEEVMNLRRCVRAMAQDPTQSAVWRTEALGLVPDRRFEEAFSDKVQLIRTRRRCSGVVAYHRAYAERMEAELMAAQDVFQEQQQRLAQLEDRLGYTASSPGSAEEAREGLEPRSRALASNRAFSTVTISHVDGAAYLPVRVPLVLAMPEDLYLAARLKQSKFAGPIRSVLDVYGQEAMAFKRNVDNSLGYIYQIATPPRVASHARDLQASEVERFLRSTNTFLIVISRSLQQLVPDLLKQEAIAQREWLEARRPTTDAATQTDEKELAAGVVHADTAQDEVQLEALLTHARQSHGKMSAYFHRTITALRATLTAVQKDFVTTHVKLRELHGAFLGTIRLVQRHCFAFIDGNIRNSFHAIEPLDVTDASGDAAGTSQYVTSVAEAVEKDVAYCTLFREFCASHFPSEASTEPLGRTQPPAQKDVRSDRNKALPRARSKPSLKSTALRVAQRRTSSSAALPKPADTVCSPVMRPKRLSRTRVPSSSAGHNTPPANNGAVGERRSSSSMSSPKPIKDPRASSGENPPSVAVNAVLEPDGGAETGSILEGEVENASATVHNRSSSASKLPELQHEGPPHCHRLPRVEPRSGKRCVASVHVSGIPPIGYGSDSGCAVLPQRLWPESRPAMKIDYGPSYYQAFIQAHQRYAQ